MLYALVLKIIFVFLLSYVTHHISMLMFYGNVVKIVLHPSFKRFILKGSAFEIIPIADQG